MESKSFGRVQDKIRTLKDLISRLQSNPQFSEVVPAEATLQYELSEFLKREELLWRDKVKTRWIEEGDANTRFFHLTTVIHRKRNSITQILNSENQWLSSRREIGQEFESYFRQLFTSVKPCFPIRLQGLLKPCISASMNQNLVAVPTQLEILHVLQQMGSLKSPGPNGFNVLFYKSYWSTVGDAVSHEVQCFFSTGKLKPAFNHTFIALLPKINSAFKVEQFRPIALCNVVYKIITKIIAGRLRPLLELIVHPSQAAFVPKRSISDNIIINHELMFYLKNKKGPNGFMAIKIDLAKAYDRVEWHVLYHMMYLLGFNDRFIDLIAECISTPQFSFQLNGSPYGFFVPERGIRQGDPISPALFTIFLDVLSRILATAEAAGRLHGIKVSRTSPRITHLMYADDLVIYEPATTQEAEAAIGCLQQDCDWTGQAINWQKSQVHFSCNTPSTLKGAICNILKMKECQHQSTYLGHTFCNFHSKTITFKGVMESMANKLSGWKRRTLSMVGRLVLVKSVIQALPTFLMQTYMFPKTHIIKMDRLCRCFLWGTPEDTVRHFYPTAWRSLCTPLCAGGLGIRNLEDVNRALVTKLTWHLNSDSHKPWV